jgi:5-methyltetrahydrofolate--homocysteine methyltransferase
MTDSELSKALAELDEQKVSTLVRKRIGSGVDAMSVIKELQEGMDTVGERYKKGEYFLSELIVSGEIFKESMKLLEPLLRAGEAGKAPRMVLGTVKGDYPQHWEGYRGSTLEGLWF